MLGFPTPQNGCASQFSVYYWFFPTCLIFQLGSGEMWFFTWHATKPQMWTNKAKSDITILSLMFVKHVADCVFKPRLRFIVNLAAFVTQLGREKAAETILLGFWPTECLATTTLVSSSYRAQRLEQPLVGLVFTCLVWSEALLVV